MLTLHGKAYHMIFGLQQQYESHMIFGLQQQYEDMNFRIVAGFIYSTVSSTKSVLLEN